MSDVDHDIRDALKRLTDPAPGAHSGVWENLVGRRRRRRVRRAAATMLPVALVAATVAFMVGVSDRGGGDRTAVATAPDGGAGDFSPFEMTYAVRSLVNLEQVEAVWELDYESFEAWELTLVDADPALGLEPGRRQVFAGGTLTDYWAAGEAGMKDDEVDDRLAPLALMSRGPRTHGTADGDLAARHEFSSSQTYQCPVEDPPPWCEEPGQSVVLDSMEVFNGDGVPVFAEDRVRGTEVVMWQFEMLSYEPRGVAGGDECAAERGSVTDLESEPDWRQHAEYRPWTDAEGCLVRIDVLAERSGPEHCGWEAADVLIMGTPLGEPYTSPDDDLHFVRDPDAVFGDPDLAAGYEPDVELPDEAVDSGFRRGGLSLWHIPGDQSAVWLAEGDEAERWPRGEPPLCR